MLREVRADFTCDECGREFSVKIEPAGKLPPGWSVFEAAEDALRGGLGYQSSEPESGRGSGRSSSVQEEKHLCGTCTQIYDRREEVKEQTVKMAALAKAYGENRIS